MNRTTNRSFSRVSIPSTAALARIPERIELAPTPIQKVPVDMKATLMAEVEAVERAKALMAAPRRVALDMLRAKAAPCFDELRAPRRYVEAKPARTLRP